MAGGVNKVILVGYLGADPDMRYTPSGQGVCELRVATSESWNDKNGQRQERTEWHRIVVWGKRAEICSKYLAKGRQVYVEGRLKTDKWQDKQSGQDRFRVKVVADTVRFLGGGGAGGARPSRPPQDEMGGPPPGFEEPADSGPQGGGHGGGGGGDDIPF